MAEKKTVTIACDQCRTSKVKCTGESPCSRCSSRGRVCTYSKKMGNPERISEDAMTEFWQRLLRQGRAEFAPIETIPGKVQVYCFLSLLCRMENNLQQADQFLNTAAEIAKQIVLDIGTESQFQSGLALGMLSFAFQGTDLLKSRHCARIAYSLASSAPLQESLKGAQLTLALLSHILGNLPAIVKPEVILQPIQSAPSLQAIMNLNPNSFDFEDSSFLSGLNLNEEVDKIFSIAFHAYLENSEGFSISNFPSSDKCDAGTKFILSESIRYYQPKFLVWGGFTEEPITPNYIPSQIALCLLLFLNFLDETGKTKKFSGNFFRFILYQSLGVPTKSTKYALQTLEDILGVRNTEREVFLVTQLAFFSSLLGNFFYENAMNQEGDKILKRLSEYSPCFIQVREACQYLERIRRKRKCNFFEISKPHEQMQATQGTPCSEHTPSSPQGEENQLMSEEWTWLVGE